MSARALLLLPLTLVSVVPTAAAPPEPWMMSAKINGVGVEGTALAYTAQQVLFLSRDGFLLDFHPSEATDFRKTGYTFQSYSVTQMRDRLERELGRAFEVSSTAHFLVAHPRGQRDAWAERFEEVYRSFVSYFLARSFDLKTPQFPLVAIVWKDQADFLRYATRDQPQINPNVLGYYSLQTNRIVLYDISEGRNSEAARKQNIDTIIHEVAHQVAFNTGVHNRLAPPPRWVTEGLGTMYEAPGVWNSRSYSRQSDRINRGRLDNFKADVASRKAGSLAELVSSDRWFNQDPQAAYAEAWALSFFLSETQPRDYARYLEKTAAREAFTEYSSTERLDDFTNIFGNNFRLLESRFLRYMETLK